MKTCAGMIYIVGMACLFLFANTGSAVMLHDIPGPEPTAKLRIFSVVVTTETKSANRSITWVVPHEKLQIFNTQFISRLLKDQGIYELVSEGDIDRVLGGKNPATWDWKAQNLSLVRQVGRTLHADYAIFFERSFRVHLEFEMRLINLNTGQEFITSNYLSTTKLGQMPNEHKKLAGAEAIKICYRQLFSDAKADLLKTALDKGRAMVQPQKPIQEARDGKNEKEKPVFETPGQARRPKDPAAPPVSAPQEAPSETIAKPKPSAEPTESSTPPPAKVARRQAAFEKDLENALFAKEAKSDKPRLIVFDFTATESMKVIGLILTESLREALMEIGGFVLVNRENILQIMDEYKLRESGMVDETQAARVGKWLTADDAVLGSLAVLGNTAVLQAKRVNIETLGTLSMGSLRCEVGHEDELLERLPQLARRLAAKKAP